MKNKLVITLLFWVLGCSLRAETNPVTISKPLVSKSKSNSFHLFGDDILCIDYKYEQTVYNDDGKITSQQPFELTLYDSAFNVRKSVKFAKINRWNYRVEVSKDGKNIFIFYQPWRWNRSVANGTVKLFCLDRNLTCTRICKFIIPGSRPYITEIERVAGNHIVVSGEFANRENRFMLNVDLATGRYVKFKLKKNEEYYVTKHFPQDNKTLVISHPYTTRSDSFMLNMFTTTGVLLKRQWITLSEGYLIQSINLVRSGKNKYIVYGQGSNDKREAGHRAYVFAILYENGKLKKTTIVNESMIDARARDDFDKVGLIPADEPQRDRFKKNRKDMRTGSDYIHFTDTEMHLDGNLYLFAGLYGRELEGGVLVELDNELKLLNSYVFPIIDKLTLLNRKYYNCDNGKSTVNSGGFYYAYGLGKNISGIHISKAGVVSGFAFDNNDSNNICISGATQKGFIAQSQTYNSSAPEGEKYTQHVWKVNVNNK
ncbi:MAG TPA: hypothetical protein VD905_19980 [Flavobacteriales bacterium]|nr:hypothetical protein [Flavobacteriales bacterium]